jgi:lysozyme
MSEFPQRALDVSDNNGRVDWSKVHGAGYRHAFAKASEGETEVDSDVRRNAEQARRAGVELSLYHFGHPSQSAARNARHFLSVIVPLVKVGDPAPVLDLEVREGRTPRELWEWQHGFCRLVGEALGTVPMIYSDASFLDSLPFPKHHRPLWGAEWGHAPASQLDRWHVWQYSAAGRVPGVPGLVDLDSILRPIPTIRRVP